MSNLKRAYLMFYLAGLALVALAGWLQRSPGYMDADYYYTGGLHLLNGSGMRQPVLWNYLDSPVGLPVPAFTYWMPFASLLSAAGAAFGGGFLTARLPFWLLAAAVPPLTLRMGMVLHGDLHKAILGAVFALFPVYYLAYLPTTDVFAAYMLFGTGILMVLPADPRSLVRWLVCGLLAGLMHFSRADGLFWAAAVFLWAFGPLLRAILVKSKPTSEMWVAAAAAGLMVLAGYFLVMSFWYVRNLQQWGWIFPPGSGLTLWLTRYEDTFVYPAALLTPQRWLATGAGQILTARGAALLSNFQTFIAAQGSIVLLPFSLGGLWLSRRWSGARFVVWPWLATLLAMTLVFPYAGINGAFFHSGAAFQPLLWAAAPLGLEASINWLAVKRKWQQGSRVLRFVEGLLVAACVLLTALIYFQKVVGPDLSLLAWNRSDLHYRAVEEKLVELGATPCLVVMVNNPPGYFAAARRSAVVIPYGDESMVLETARRFDVSYLVLEENDAGHLARLYKHPGDVAGLNYLGEVNGTKLYAFTHSQ